MRARPASVPDAPSGHPEPPIGAPAATGSVPPRRRGRRFGGVSRPVGAAGAGCGGAGLLGILLAVAIAVWLGSQSLGGIGGGSGRGDGDGDGETATSVLATQTAEAITGTLDPAGPVAVGQVVRLRAPIGAGAATLRVCLSAGERAPDTTRCSVRALTTDVESEAMNAQGVELRSDHGPQYTGSDAAALARKWGLEQTFAPVGRPTGNAVAERTIQTMKLECIWLEEFEGVDDLQAALDRWMAVFNHERPHQALNWQTPVERRCERLGLPLPDRAMAS